MGRVQFASPAHHIFLVYIFGVLFFCEFDLRGGHFECVQMRIYLSHSFIGYGVLRPAGRVNGNDKTFQNSDKHSIVVSGAHRNKPTSAPEERRVGGV